MNRIVEKVNFPIPKQPKAKRIAGLLKCENVQGKEHLIKGGEHNGNKKGDGYSAHNKSAYKNFEYNGQEKTNSRLCSCFD